MKIFRYYYVYRAGVFHVEHRCLSYLFRDKRFFLTLTSLALSVQKIVGFSDTETTPPRVVKAVPLPPVAEHMGVTVVNSSAPYAVDLFNTMGEVVVVTTDEELHALQAATCLMGPFYELVATAKNWMVQQRVPEATAAKYAGALFR